MINLRYHIVSLVAVFLALAIGIIVGTTTIDQSVVTRLEAQKRAADDRQRRLEAQNRSLEHEVQIWESFATDRIPSLLSGALGGRAVVVIAGTGVDDDLLKSIDDIILTAGGARGGRIRFTDKWQLPTRDERDELSLALGIQTADATQLLTEGARIIATRLATPTQSGNSGDLLQGLSRAGFLELKDLPRTQFPSPSASMLVVWSGSEGAMPPAGMMLPLLEAIPRTIPTAVAEPLDAAESLVAQIRADDELELRIATVDHADTVPGLYSLMTSLRDLSRGLRAAHYGVGSNAESPVPTPSP